MNIHNQFWKIKKNVFPNEEYLVCQKTPNIRIHFPECTNIGKLETDPNKDIIGLHNDSMFNHPENEINLMIPLTNMYDTNSLFIQTDLEKEDINSYNHQINLGNLSTSLYFIKVESNNGVNTFKLRVR